MNLERRWPIIVFVVLLCMGVAATTVVTGQSSPPGPPSADTLITLARNTAAVDGRNVMVRFRASWCEWCARLEAALHSFELGWTIRDNYVLVALTVQESEEKIALENPGAQELMDAAGGSGLPFYLFIDPEGHRIADSMVMPDGGNIGYPVTPEEIESFSDLMALTAPRMSDADRARVVDYLFSHAPE